MRKTKKVISMVMAVSLIAASLAGCGSDKPEPTTVPTDTTATTKRYSGRHYNRNRHY